MASSKLLPLNFDLGNIAVFDINPLDHICAQMSKDSREEALLTLAQENTQTLLTQLFSLPVVPSTSDSEPGTSVLLPTAVVRLPREKPLPKATEPTRWEQFAKVKGIQKRKRGSKLFDEASGEWKPRYGSKSAKNDPMQNWCEEVNE